VYCKDIRKLFQHFLVRNFYTVCS